MPWPPFTEAGDVPAVGSPWAIGLKSVLEFKELSEVVHLWEKEGGDFYWETNHNAFARDSSERDLDSL